MPGESTRAGCISKAFPNIVPNSHSCNASVPSIPFYICSVGWLAVVKELWALCNNIYECVLL